MVDLKKAHKEDWDMARDFNRAEYFTAYIHCGMGIRESIRDLPSYESAIESANNLEKKYAQYRRRALIYAVVPGYSVLCTPMVVEIARLMREDTSGKLKYTNMLRPPS